MNELVERYVHQVGLYLPPKERADIEAELRSQIQDQLDDRYGDNPAPDEVARILAEFGPPYRMAASYNREGYLVGPDLYPFMMIVLRRGGLIVPFIVAFLSIFGAVTASDTIILGNWLVETLFSLAQTTFFFCAVVVFIFAIIQRLKLTSAGATEDFDPLQLPKVDDPTAVVRAEIFFGIATGAIVALALLYFLRDGALTLAFSVGAPISPTPIPLSWTLALMVVLCALIALHLLVLRRNRWSALTWLAEMLLETVGSICLYFVLYEPLYQHLLALNPALAQAPLLDKLPELIAISYVVILFIARGGRLSRLWSDSAIRNLQYLT